MHKFILWIFESLRNIEKFLRVVCVFIIMMLALYWTMNLIGVTWKWIGFISPLLDGILDFVNNIYSFSFDFWGKTMEIKYFNAVLLILLAIGALKGIAIIIDNLQDFYENTYIKCKKINEKIFNQNLDRIVKTDEKQKNKYMLFIQTRPAKKYVLRAGAIDMAEQNSLMNKFISEKLNVQPTEAWEGFVYYFNDFEKIDDVIDVLFKIINSSAPLEYFMCIQIGEETDKLKMLVAIQEWNKIILAADTLNRYRYNASNKYEISNVGVFQKEAGTLEIHEIINNEENSTKN